MAFDTGNQIPRRNKHINPVEHIRQPVKVDVKDIEREPYKYLALALTHLQANFAKLPTMIEDNARPVDEYQPQTLSPESTNNILLQPQYESAEIIRGILITGPAAAAVTIQLGDRTWPLIIGASGFLIMSPLWIMIDRSDVRQLTASVAGQYSFELMGHADTRGITP